MWVANSFQGRHADEGAAPSSAVVDTAKHVGDPVAVGDRRDVWTSAQCGDLVEIEYEVLAAVTSGIEALKEDSVQVHPEVAPGNLCYDWHLGDAGQVEEAFAKAAHIAELDLVNNRLVANAMEPRAAIGVYDSIHDSYTLYTTSQNPHVIRLLMGGLCWGFRSIKLRVVAPDVGGGIWFEDLSLCGRGDRHVGGAAGSASVKWTCERSDSFISDAQGRDHVTKVSLARWIGRENFLDCGFRRWPI